jgi:hypothetical protein
MSLFSSSDDVLIKFGSTDRSLNSVGYAGNNDRVTGALNQHFFANEIAVAGVELPSRLFGQEATGFSSQSVGNMAANGMGGRQQ